MEKEFVTYEQALALKELGFDEPCFGNYNNLTDKTRFIFGKTNEGSITVNKVPGTDDIVISNERILAPTFSQTFRWFREKYNLVHRINRDGGYWECAILNLYDEKEQGTIEIYLENCYPDSYEEAELECLKKLIKIIKNEK